MTDTNVSAAMQSETNVKGIFALIGATICFSFQDATTKHLTDSLHAWQIVSIRFFFFSLFALIYGAKTIGLQNAFRSNNTPLQFLRGILIVSEIALFAFVLSKMGLAEMHAIFACFPLMITALSGPMLGEQVGWRRWLAVLIGFIGALIILKPGTGVFNPYAIYALLTAAMFAVYSIWTRKVSRKDTFETSMLYFGVAGFIFSLFFVPFYWIALTTNDVFFLFISCSTSILGHCLLIKALELTPVVILQPFNYFILVWAMIMGYVVFGEVLDGLTLVGIAIVVASGVFIARREYNLSKY